MESFEPEIIHLESQLKFNKYTSDTWPFKILKQVMVLTAHILSVLSNEAETKNTVFGANYI